MAVANSAAPALLVLPGTMGTALADQDSTLGAALIEASGTVGVAGDSYLMTPADLNLVTFFYGPPSYTYGNFGDTNEGRSSFSVTFALSEATAYSLDGVVALTTLQAEIVPGALSGSGFIELSESGGATIARTDLACSFSPCELVPGGVIAAAGTLPAGSYTLSAEIVGQSFALCVDVGSIVCDAPELAGSFSLALTLEPPSLPALGGVGTTGLVLGLIAVGVGLRTRAL